MRGSSPRGPTRLGMVALVGLRWTTGYGITLLVKLALFAGVLGMGAYNNLEVQPGLGATVACGGKSTASSRLSSQSSTASVSQGFFDALGVYPLVGRAFVPEEQRLGAATALVVGHGFWQRHLGARDDLSGLTLRIENDQAVVVGVMPPGFDFPDGAELWIPSELRAPGSRTAHNYDAIGRLAEGVSLPRARDDIRSIARLIHQEHGQDTNLVDAAVIPLHDIVVGGLRPALVILLVAAGLLWLIGCVNVANLLIPIRTIGNVERISSRR